MFIVLERCFPIPYRTKEESSFRRWNVGKTPSEGVKDDRNAVSEECFGVKRRLGRPCSYCTGSLSSFSPLRLVFQMNSIGARLRCSFGGVFSYLEFSGYVSAFLNLRRDRKLKGTAQMGRPN